MTGTLRLAIKYIAHNKFKSLILIGCIFLTALLPIAIKLLLLQFEQKILARADSTPVIIGAAGSQLDLTLHALDFKTAAPGTVTMQAVELIRDSQYATPIPIAAEFTARKYPLVGTSLEYFPFRRLKFAEGGPFALLGECVLGAEVAKKLDLHPGDSILSDRDNELDIAGRYPLKMQVVGVLAASRTEDDSAVFADIKTVWVNAGLGHGHQELADETDPGKIMARTDDGIVATAAVLPYNEVTDANRDSFHFHGDVSTFPLTAIIAIPNDTRSQTLLEGRFQTGNAQWQFVEPSRVIREFMELVFRIKLIFDTNAMLIAISTLLLLGLVVMLSLKLRQREMQTMFKIGCSRGTIWMMQLWELGLIFGVSISLVAVASWLIWSFAGRWVESLLLQG